VNRRIPRAVALACLLSACGQSPIAPVADSGAAYVPTADWRTARPGAVGLSDAGATALAHDIDGGRYGAVQGVVIVRFGWLAFEHYHNWSRSTTHTMQSVTKSVTSLLYGIARQQAAGAPLASLDTSVVDLLSRYTPANLDSNKRALSIRDLLTMRTAMDFWEQPYDGSPLQQMNQSAGDWVQFVIDREMLGIPGTTWAYNSGSPILVCGVMRDVLGEAPDAFAARALFGPLGVTSASWYRSPHDDLPHCGGGLFLTAADLARVGYLVLRHGRWGEQQVVPAAWIDESTQPISTGPPLFFSDWHSGYGYYWWLFPDVRGGTTGSVIAASGSGGQWLFVVPGRDLVVAVIGTNAYGLDLLYDGVLPLIQ